MADRPRSRPPTLPHEAMMRSIELYGREVMPRVRELVAAASPVLASEGRHTKAG